MSAEILKKLDEISRDIGGLRVATAKMEEKLDGVDDRLCKVEGKLDDGFGARLRKVEQKVAALGAIIGLLFGAAGLLKLF